MLRKIPALHRLDFFNGATGQAVFIFCKILAAAVAFFDQAEVPPIRRETGMFIKKLDLRHLKKGGNSLGFAGFEFDSSGPAAAVAATAAGKLFHLRSYPE